MQPVSPGVTHTPSLAALERRIIQQPTVLGEKLCSSPSWLLYTGFSRCIILALDLMNVKSLFRCQNWAKQSGKPVPALYIPLVSATAPLDPLASALWSQVGGGTAPAVFVTPVTSRKKLFPLTMISRVEAVQRRAQRLNEVVLDLHPGNSGRSFCEPGKDWPNEACTNIDHYISAFPCGLCSELWPAANVVERCLPSDMCAKSGHSLHGDLQQGVR